MIGLKKVANGKKEKKHNIFICKTDTTLARKAEIAKTGFRIGSKSNSINWKCIRSVGTE